MIDLINRPGARATLTFLSVELRHTRKCVRSIIQRLKVNSPNSLETKSFEDAIAQIVPSRNLWIAGE